MLTSLLVALLAEAFTSSCGGTPNRPDPVPQQSPANYTGTLTSANYPPMDIDLWFGSAAQGGTATSIAGHYSTTSGVRGDVNGSIAGTLAEGTFTGTLGYESSPLGGLQCAGSATVTGQISAGRIHWTSPGFQSRCVGNPSGLTMDLMKLSTPAPAAGPAVLAVTFHPDPVEGFIDPACNGQTGWRYAVSVKNVNGVGVHVTSWTQQFAAAGVPLLPATYPESDFAAQFGSSRIEPFETRSSNLIGFCLAAPTGTTGYRINGTDDRGNAVAFDSTVLNLLPVR